MTNREPFGAWLLAQRRRSGWIGDLAEAAKKDPAFPVRGEPAAVYARLNALQADPEMFEAMEDAEAEWRASGDA